MLVCRFVCGMKMHCLLSGGPALGDVLLPIVSLCCEGKAEYLTNTTDVHAKPDNHIHPKIFINILSSNYQPRHLGTSNGSRHGAGGGRYRSYSTPFCRYSLSALDSLWEGLNWGHNTPATIMFSRSKPWDSAPSNEIISFPPGVLTHPSETVVEGSPWPGLWWRTLPALDLYSAYLGTFCLVDFIRT